MSDLQPTIDALKATIANSPAIKSDAVAAALMQLCDLSDGLNNDVVLVFGTTHSGGVEDAIAGAAHDVKHQLPDGLYFGGGCGSGLGHYATLYKCCDLNPYVIPESANIVVMKGDGSLAFTGQTLADFKQQHATPATEGLA